MKRKINKKLQIILEKMKKLSLHSILYYLNKKRRQNFVKRKFLKIVKFRYIKFLKYNYVKQKEILQNKNIFK